MTTARANGDQGTGARLLADIRSVLARENEIFSAVLVERLNALDEAPWGGWRKGNGIQARDIAGLLGEFGMRSKNIRIGTEQKKGYEAAQFTDAFTRYLPPPPEEEDTPGRSVPTSQNGQRPGTPPLTTKGTPGRLVRPFRGRGTQDGIADRPQSARRSTGDHPRRSRPARRCRRPPRRQRHRPAPHQRTP